MQLNIQRRHKHLQPIPRLPKLGNAIKQPRDKHKQETAECNSDIYLVVQLIAAVKLILVFRHQTGKLQLTACILIFFHKINNLFHLPVILKPVAALRTKFKILCCLISAVAAAPISMTTASLIHQSQMLRQNLHLVPARDRLSNFRIQLIQGIAATHLHIIMPVPFKTWNKKQR